MNFGFLEFLTLFGSLSLFLFGMKTMSDGIQKVAGDKMRSILSVMTSNRFMGVLTGLVVTMLVQSSSASTVMVVSFVNAGLLNLTQAVGVIMGANIGTTTTAWIITLLGFSVNISSFSLPLIAVSFPLLMMSREKMNNIGETLLGFALLFLGLEFLKNSVPDLESNPQILEALSRLTDYGFNSTLIFLGIGTLLTIILQSSSATMALTLVMCNNGWIGFEHGAALVLGENLGTTITANIAALMGNSQAKRAAMAHTLFNLAGVIWMLLVFKSFVGQIDNFMVRSGLGSPFTVSTMVPIGLSIFHSSFNVINTFVHLGFLKYFVYVVEHLLPFKDKKFERPQLEFFSSGFLQAAELSVFQARKETKRFAELSHRMFNFIPAMIIETDKKEFEDLRERVSKYEEITDRVEVEITTFLIQISKKQLSGHTAEELRRMRVVCAEVERIGDVCYKMSTLLAKKKEEKVYFTPAQRSELFEMFKLTNDAFEQMLENLEKGENFARQNLSRSIELEHKINAFRDAVGEEVIEDIEKGVAHVKSSFYFNKLISSCEKIGDTLLNISEAVAGASVE